MKQLLILALFSLLLFTACDSQVGTAVGAALENIVTGKAFSGSSGDKAYAVMKEETILTSTKTEPEVCLSKDNSSSISPLKTSADMSKIKDKMCLCKVWGTCDSSSCSCGVLCPNNFNILSWTGLATTDSSDNSLAFTNGDRDFYDKDKNYAGYCWGHAVVTQRFNRLAKFNPSSPKQFTGTNQDHERRSFYKDLIKKINNNEPTEIPGFKSLYEFSRNPEVKTLLEESVKDNWAENAMSIQGLSLISNSEPQGADYYNKLFDDIDFKLKHFQSPTIVFNDRNSSTYSHAVLVNSTGVSSNGERYLCLRDNNYSSDSTSACQQKLTLRKDGTTYYNAWSSSIGRVSLSHTENNNTMEQIKNLREKCQNDKKCTSAN